MYSFIYIGKKNIDSFFIEKKDILEKKSFEFLIFNSIEDALNIFYTDKILVSLIIEENLEGLENFISDLKKR